MFESELANEDLYFSIMFRIYNKIIITIISILVFFHPKYKYFDQIMKKIILLTFNLKNQYKIEKI